MALEDLLHCYARRIKSLKDRGEGAMLVIGMDRTTRFTIADS